jgi:hypothetical protein
MNIWQRFSPFCSCLFTLVIISFDVVPLVIFCCSFLSYFCPIQKVIACAYILKCLPLIVSNFQILYLKTFIWCFFVLVLSYKVRFGGVLIMLLIVLFCFSSNISSLIPDSEISYWYLCHFTTGIANLLSCFILKDLKTSPKTCPEVTYWATHAVCY